MGRRHRQDHPGALHFVTNRGTAQTTGLPLSEIAQRCGLRTADSVQSSIRRLRERSACDPTLAAHLHRLGLERRLAG